MLKNARFHWESNPGPQLPSTSPPLPKPIPENAVLFFYRKLIVAALLLIGFRSGINFGQMISESSNLFGRENFFKNRT